MQRVGGDFVDSRAHPGETEEGVHQNEAHHQFSGKLMGQTSSLALEMRKFSEESYEEHLALQIPEERCKNNQKIIAELRKENRQQRESGILFK